jgi:YidC/Oxa1 family membrane protein insertase
MANLRPVLIITLLFLAYLLWVEWQKDYGPQPQREPTTAQGEPGSSERLPTEGLPEQAAAREMPGDLPVPPEAAADAAQEQVQAQEVQGDRALITVLTDVLDVEIDPVGGTLVTARLRNYPVSLERPDDKVMLFSREADRLFIAQSGLLSRQAAPNHTSPYVSTSMSYTMPEDAAELRVPLTWSDASGVSVTKTFVFKPGRYDIEVRHELSNNSAAAWAGSRYDQLQRAKPAQEEGRGFTNPGSYSFNGIGFYTPEEKFEKVDYDDVASEAFQRSTSGGWLAMIQHYFFAAWIPPAEQINTLSTQAFAPSGWPRYIARAVSPPVTVSPGQRHEFNSRLFVGPKLQEQLDDIAPGLQHTVNYGIFTVFSKPLFWLLSAIHNFVGNWGWAIIFLTVLIKLAFFKLTEAQYKSMARMRKLQPRVEALKERYGDDRQRMSQAMMEMYKKEKVNPLGGCLPILVQIPIFIALYWVLLESVELRQAPFIGWISNLSERDPYFILPALNAFFMIMTQRLTPTTGMDPMQAKMMKAMPLVFSVLFAFFPAGLVLYWATNAGLSLAQQWYITRKIAAAD